VRIAEIEPGMRVYIARTGEWDQKIEDPATCLYIVKDLEAFISGRRAVRVRPPSSSQVTVIPPGLIKGPYADTRRWRDPVLLAARKEREMQRSAKINMRIKVENAVRRARELGFNIDINEKTGMVWMSTETLARASEWYR
jgi:hypothetical protein